MKIRIGICDDSDHDRHYLKSIIKNYFKGREIEPEICLLYTSDAADE